MSLYRIYSLGFRQRLSCLLPVALSAVALLAVTSSALAAPINHGSFSGADVDFLAVTENSKTDPTPLFGLPTIAGNTLTFNPTSFSASTNGSGPPDLTDGLLTTLIMATGSSPILSVDLAESGHYSLGGVGVANATVSTPVFLTVLQVNNASIVPFTISGNLAFTPSGGTFDLVNDPGVNVPWSGVGSFDVATAVAAHGFSGGATKVRLTLNNTLVAFSQGRAGAEIEKDEVEITINTPEPGTLVLLALGAGLALLSRVRRRR